MRVIYFLAAALLSLTAAQAQDRFGQIQKLNSKRQNRYQSI